MAGVSRFCPPHYLLIIGLLFSWSESSHLHLHSRMTEEIKKKGEGGAKRCNYYLCLKEVSQKLSHDTFFLRFFGQNLLHGYS